MTLVLIEGFDHINSVTALTAKGWQRVPAASDAVSMVAGRLSGGAYQVIPNSAGGQTQFKKNLPTTYTTFVIGFAFKFDGLPAATQALCGVGGNTLLIQVTPLGKINLASSGGANLTGTQVMTAGSWQFIEVKLVVAGASGSAVMQLNGVVDIPLTTANFGSTAAGDINFINARSSPWTTIAFDDVYFLNTASTPNNNFLGDVHVQTIYPIADGATLNWTPNSGTAHFSRVNEVSPDDDTSYVASSTVNQIDTYDFTALGIGSASPVYGLQTNLYARKDDANVRQIADVVRSGGTNFVGTTKTLTTSYVDYMQIREVDPGTSAAWTVSGVDAAEFGVKVIT